MTAASSQLREVQRDAGTETGDATPDPLRVLQVFEPPDGGVAEHVARLAQGLVGAGHDVRVAGPADAAIRGSLDVAIRYYPLPLTRSYRRPWLDLDALARIGALLRAERFDLLHAHSAKAGVLGRVASRLSNVPCVYTPHCYAFMGEVSCARQGFARTVERALGPLTARTICVCADEREQAIKRGVGPPERLSVIYNGVDPCHPIHAEPELRSNGAEEILVGAVAVHRRQKGIDRLLQVAPEVLDRCPQVRIAIVGNGPLLDAHRQQARALGLRSRVSFHAFRPPMARYLRALDVFVLPSRWEAFPIAVLESMSCGTPVVASDTGGTREALEAGAGVLVPNGDRAALVQAIVDLASSAERRASIAHRAQALVAQRFTIPQMVAQTIEVYRDTADPST
jgi:glycosyltransferase involved in cell wall biosynthesis